MIIEHLDIDLLQLNEGQIEGLPTNPRTWTAAELRNLAKSIKETPEEFEARPILAVKHGDAYVVLGGNMRLEASRKNGAKEVPVIVFPETTAVSKLKEIVIKDNGSFGDWDYDALANEWDDLPLPEWGVPAWETEPKQEPEDREQKDGDFKVEISCTDETDADALHLEMENRGYKCRIINA